MSDIKRNPFEETFEEYLKFHQNVMDKANKRMIKITETDDKSITVEELIKTHNMIPLDEFLENMRKLYGI